MPADGISLLFTMSGDVGASRLGRQLCIEIIRSNAHPKDPIFVRAEQAIRSGSATAIGLSPVPHPAMGRVPVVFEPKWRCGRTRFGGGTP